MHRQIRILGIFLLACFSILFLQLNNIQLLQAHKLASAPGNPRTALARISQPRGSIETGDGVVIANSVKTNDSLHYLRVYPHGPLYSDITGFDSPVYGSTGVEATYNHYLTAHSSSIKSLSDLFKNNTTTDNVVLTISSKLQSLAARELGNRPGSVVALDPSTGAILAMYSSPSYDPNLLASHNTASEVKSWKAYLADPSQPLLARAYAQIYPPGSTFKIVTASAVYQQDPSLASVNYPPVPSITLPQTTHVLHNYGDESCGGTIPKLFQVSCDTGFAQVGLALGAKRLAAEAHAFGFGSVPPLDIPGAAASRFPAASSFSQNLPSLAFSAIGQGNVAASTLQMAMVAGAIANGGTMMTPHVMAQIRSSQGTLVKAYHPSVWRRATSGSAAKKVTSIMKLVTASGGTAPNVSIPGVQVAAKTGTAQIGNALHQNDDWLVAFAPAQAPRLVVAVTVDNQPEGTVGSTTAGPIAKAILSAYLGVAS